MKNQEQKELEHMALSAELARPLVHDFGNFLYNLFLQMEIWETIPQTQPPDWSPIKAEGKKVAQLLKEWQSSRNPSQPIASKVDFDQLIQQLASDLGTSDRSIQILPRATAEPPTFISFPGEVKRLCHLLIEYSLSVQPVTEATGPALVVQLEKTNDNIALRISSANSLPANSPYAAFDETVRTRSPGLTVAACKALAQRLDATIRLDRATDGQTVLVLEFPPNVF